MWCPAPHYCFYTLPQLALADTRYRNPTTSPDTVVTIMAQSSAMARDRPSTTSLTLGNYGRDREAMVECGMLQPISCTYSLEPKISDCGTVRSGGLCLGSASAFALLHRRSEASHLRINGTFKRTAPSASEKLPLIPRGLHYPHDGTRMGASCHLCHVS